LVPGAFVPVLFPTAEKPRAPVLLHIGYVIGTTAAVAMVAYTISRLWPVDVPLPLGARVSTADQARALNQNRACLLRMDMLAKLRITKTWFSRTDQPGHGVIAVALAALARELTNLGTELVRRRHARIEFRGV
jgi:hypothetical protein